MLSSQLVVTLPRELLYGIIGAPVALYAGLQLVGWRLVIRPERRDRAEVIAGVIGGFFGGLSGIWGPPVVAFLSATDTPKAEHVRVQGIVYGLGAVVLMASHVRSGIFSSYSAPFSTWMLVPTIVGLGLGMLLQDKMNQKVFLRFTMIVLLVAGLNLLRRSVM